MRLGTRGSDLAMAQARRVAALIAARGGPAVEIVTIATSGDVRTSAPLTAAGAKGLFTKEIEEALLEGRIDLAVHSLKDLPTEMPAGLAIGAVPEREDPSDALVAPPGARLATLRAGARVGTSSPRRRAQLLAARRDLDVVEMRGNVPTRLARQARGDFDAVVLARAGLVRLGLAGRIAEVLSAETMLPAPGQGAIAVEIRDGDRAARAVCEAIDDAAARAATDAERALLAALGGGCRLPVAALAVSAGARGWRGARVAAPWGETILAGEDRGDATDAAGLGARLAAALVARGAARLLAAIDADARGAPAREAP
jgi:hydroxymethylbilane synthase